MSHEVARHPPRRLQLPLPYASHNPRSSDTTIVSRSAFNDCGKLTSPYVAFPAISIPSSLTSSVNNPGALSSSLDLPHIVVAACLCNTALPHTSNFLLMGRTLVVAHRKAKSKTASHAPKPPASLPRRRGRWVWERLVEVGQTTGGREPGGAARRNRVLAARAGDEMLTTHSMGRWERGFGEKRLNRKRREAKKCSRDKSPLTLSWGIPF